MLVPIEAQTVGSCDGTEMASKPLVDEESPTKVVNGRH